MMNAFNPSIRVLLWALITGSFACGGAVESTEPAPASDPAPIVEPFTYGQSVAAVLAPLCDKMQECWPARFNSQEPGGVTQCEREWIAPITKEVSARPAICTREEIAACAQGLRAVSCEVATPSDTINFPTSCAPCFIR